MYPVPLAFGSAGGRCQARATLDKSRALGGVEQDAMHTEVRLPDTPGLAAAAALLRIGRLVAFPTETVYGLGADATSGVAVAGIYAAKGRPRFNPLIAHVAAVGDALEQGLFDRDARALADAFWPGPLTVVVPASPGCTVCDLARAGLPSVGLRVPGHPIARALLAEAGFPVAAPSANRSGRISPTSAGHVASELDGRCDLVLDGGPTAVGLESTIVACLDGTPRLLRPGGLPRDAIERILGRPLAGPRDATLHAPGMLASHYAPTGTVRLDATDARQGDAVLDFAGQLGAGRHVLYRDLSPEGRLDEAAANLFSFLRALDVGPAGHIAVAPIPTTGLGEAINDRLARAAAPRPR